MTFVEFVQQFEDQVKATIKETADAFEDHAAYVYRVALRGFQHLISAPSDQTRVEVPDPFDPTRVFPIEGATLSERKKRALEYYVTAALERFCSQMRLCLYVLARLTVGLEKDQLLLVLPDPRLYEFADAVHDRGAPRISDLHTLFGFNEQTDIPGVRAGVARTRLRIMTLAVWKELFRHVKEHPEEWSGSSETPRPTAETRGANAETPLPKSHARNAESGSPAKQSLVPQDELLEAEAELDLGRMVDDYLGQLDDLAGHARATDNLEAFCKRFTDEKYKGKYSILKFVENFGQLLPKNEKPRDFLGWLRQSNRDSHFNFIRELIPGRPTDREMKEARAFYRKSKKLNAE